MIGLCIYKETLEWKIVIYRTTFKKRLQHLFIFEVLRCSYYWRVTLKRQVLSQSKKIIHMFQDFVNRVNMSFQMAFSNNKTEPPFWYISPIYYRSTSYFHDSFCVFALIRAWQSEMFINPFVPNAPFLYPL